MVEWKDSLFRAFSDWKTLLLGLIISIVPVLNFATYGFGLNCARKPYDRKLPSFRQFGGLWVQGLLSVIIMVLYSLPALIVFGIGYLTDQYDTLILIIAGIFAVVAYYFLPMAWMKFAYGKFGGAFRLGAIAGKCFSLKYFGAWLLLSILTFIIAVLLNFIAILLSFTIVGPFIIMGFLAFWLAVFGFTIYGQLYEELR